MENEENGDDDESSFIPLINFLKQKIINIKVLPSIFKEYTCSKFIFAMLLSWIDQYNHNNRIITCRIYFSIKEVY